MRSSVRVSHNINPNTRHARRIVRQNVHLGMERACARNCQRERVRNNLFAGNIVANVMLIQTHCAIYKGERERDDGGR